MHLHDRIVHVLSGEVGIGLEHFGGEIAPNHGLDDAVRKAGDDQVDDSRMPEYVRVDFLCDTGPFCNPSDQYCYSLVQEGLVSFDKKYRIFWFNLKWIV